MKLGLNPRAIFELKFLELNMVPLFYSTVPYPCIAFAGNHIIIILYCIAERLVMREDSLRRTIEALQIDNDALELENKDVLDKLKLTENKAGRLQKDLECLLNEKVPFHIIIVK